MIPAVEFSVTAVLILAIAGMGVSVLSILEKHVPAIASFCAIFGAGCQKTMDFTLLRVPIAWWGLVFYLVLIFIVFAVPALIFPAVMAGVGFEFTFLWIMISIGAFCIFCMLNAIVVVGLFLFTFSLDLFWPAAAIALFFFMISNFLIARENVEELDLCPAPDADAVEKPVARINGETISSGELETPLKQAIHEHEMKIYQLKRDRLEKMILDRLAEKGEENKIPAGTIEPKQRSEIIKSLEERESIEIFLEKPTMPFLDVDISGSPAVGPVNAPVVIIEFSDYFCPYCREMHPMKDHVRNAYGDRIQWVFKDFPLDMHKGAREAAEVVRCADNQGKFWDYQDLLFAHGEEPDEDTFDEFARKLGLDEQKFRQCRTARAYREKVEKDIQDGLSVGVGVTPTFLINKQMVSGSLTREEFMAVVEAELKKTGETTGN
jgi:protein-disulfide isomerase